MGMARAARYWTPEEVRELIQEDRAWPRYECIDGALLVTPAPKGAHQPAVAALFGRIWAYLREHPVATVLTSPADIQFPGSLVQPDIFAFPKLTAPMQDWSDIRHLILAIEVISPSSVRTDREEKRKLYQREGVSEYWIVDVENRRVERWHPDDVAPEILTEALVWQPSERHPPLVIELSDVFREALAPFG
jgi:Uma2 family endonuclease